MRARTEPVDSGRAVISHILFIDLRGRASKRGPARSFSMARKRGREPRGAFEKRIVTVAATMALLWPVAAWPQDHKTTEEQAQAEQSADKPQDEKPQAPAAALTASAPPHRFLLPPA